MVVNKALVAKEYYMTSIIIRTVQRIFSVTEIGVISPYTTVMMVAVVKYKDVT
jgi:hypothetical protein